MKRSSTCRTTTSGYHLRMTSAIRAKLEEAKSALYCAKYVANKEAKLMGFDEADRLISEVLAELKGQEDESGD